MLSNYKQQAIQELVDMATPHEREAMYQDAHVLASGIMRDFPSRDFSGQNRETFETAVEIMARVLTVEAGKGWWFRYQQRIEITQAFLDSGTYRPDYGNSVSG